MEADPPIHLPAEEAAALFSEVERLRKQVLELERDIERWKNGHAVVLAEWTYWFNKCMSLYEQRERKGFF